MVMFSFPMPRFCGRNHIYPRGNSLADCFINEDSCRRRHIQGVRQSQHRNSDTQICAIHPLGGQTILFRTKCNRDIAGEILLKMQLFGVRSGGEYLEIALLEEG